MTEPATRPALQISLPVLPNVRMSEEQSLLGLALAKTFEGGPDGVDVTPANTSSLLNALSDAVEARLITVLTVITENDVTKTTRHIHPESIASVETEEIKDDDGPFYRVSCLAGGKKLLLVATPHKEIADFVQTAVTLIISTPYAEDAVAARGVALVIGGVIEVEVTEQAENDSNICECGRDHAADMAAAKSLFQSLKNGGGSLDEILSTLDDMGVNVSVIDIGGLRDL